MEKMTSQENPEQKLINLLKEKGLEDPTTKELLKAWTVKQEKWAENQEDFKGAQIEVNLKRGRFYFAAGMMNESYESFEDARMQAWNESREDLYKKIMTEMDTLENSLNT